MRIRINTQFLEFSNLYKENDMHKVGDKVWYIPGYGGDYLLIVECTIIEVDDEFYKMDPEACMFYDVDEHIGHFLDESDFYTSLEEAKKTLLFRGSESNESNPNADLNKFRKKIIDFIVETWEDLDDLEKMKRKTELFDSLPEKKQGVQWLNLNDLNSEIRNSPS